MWLSLVSEGGVLSGCARPLTANALCLCVGQFVTAEYGKAMNKQVEERLSFYEYGVVPRKNIDVMHRTAVKVQNAKVQAVAKAGTIKPSKRKKSQDEDKVDLIFDTRSCFHFLLS